MKQFRKIIYICCLGIIGMNVPATAQEGTTLNFMQLLPQHLKNNPAYDLPYNWYLSFPALSSINIKLDNNFIDASLNGAKFVRNDSALIDVEKFLGTLNNNNIVSFTGYYEPISFGFRVKKSFFHVNFFEHLNANTTFSKSFFNLLGHGTASTEGEPVVLENNTFNMFSYKGVGVGWRYQLNDKLAFGITAKYLNGDLDVYTQKSYFKLAANPNGEVPYEMQINSDVSLLASFPGDSLNGLTDLSTTDYLNWVTNFGKNNGFGLDLGATYKLNDKIDLGASVLDFGFIRWDAGVQHLRSSTSYNFKGIEVNTLNGSMDSVFMQLLDTLQDKFKFVNDGGGAYTRFLHTKIVLSGTYALTKNHVFGAMFRGEFNYGTFRPTFTLAYTLTLLNRVNITLNNSIIGNQLWNFGGGLALGFGPLQLYTIVDQVNSFYVANMKSVNVHVGLNLTFGNRNYRKSQMNKTAFQH